MKKSKSVVRVPDIQDTFYKYFLAEETPPKPLDFASPQKWDEWKKRFKRYRIAAKLNKDSDEIKVNTLLYTMHMGPESEHIFTQFELSEEDAKNFKTVTDKFDEHFNPKKNIVHKRAMFHQRSGMAMLVALWRWRLAAKRIVVVVYCHQFSEK